jgi:hypothetical protein
MPLKQGAIRSRNMAWLGRNTFQQTRSSYIGDATWLASRKVAE